MTTEFTAADLLALLREVEKEDPIDFADLPFKEEGMRELVADAVFRQVSGMAESKFSEQDCLLTLMAITAKLVLENLTLQCRMLRMNSASPEESLHAMQSLMQRLGR